MANSILPTPNNFGTETRSRTPAPTEVRWALRLLWLSLAISVVQFLFFLPIAIRALPTDPAGRQPMIIGYVITIAGFFLSAYLNIKIAHKKNWARTGKLLLAATSLFFQAMFSPRLTAFQYISVGMAPALNFAALYLLFLTSGRLWFRQPSSRTED
jgi:hypothetical protein